MPSNPPNVNGIAELTAAETATILTKLQAIQTAFIATDDQPVCDTFYITATYNKANKGKEINGDTAQFILAGDANAGA